MTLDRCSRSNNKQNTTILFFLLQLEKSFAFPYTHEEKTARKNSKDKILTLLTFEHWNIGTFGTLEYLNILTF